MKNKTKHVILFFVLLVIGFLTAYSYQYASAVKDIPEQVKTSEWLTENKLRTEVLEQQKLNQQKQKELQQLREKIETEEEKLAKQEKIIFNYVEELEKFRMITGQKKISGPGIKVTLSDSEYIPDDKNPNNYIVHEEHIRNIIYEMLVTGAEAVAVNGQRISSHSYIECVGPVVKIDGRRYPAPFVITAIGNPDFLNSSLLLEGNVIDQLVQQNVDVKIKKQENIVMKPYYYVQNG